MGTRLIAVVGETASGKSSLAYRLAKALDGEIICADSWSVYKGFDIGSAKPSAVEQAAVPHYLLDVAEPESGFSAAVFKRLAEAAIRDIADRGKLPIIAGGSGLYVDSILYDYNFLPPPSAETRHMLNSLTIPELLHRATKQGIATDDIDIRNKRRIIRLLENGGKLPTRKGLRASTLVIGLKPDREALRERIVQRVDAMIVAGLENEVRMLYQRYGWDIEAMKGIGYREWQSYFDGRESLEEARQRIIRNTVMLAKKQRTWFGRNPDINWLNSPEEATAFAMLRA